MPVLDLPASPSIGTVSGYQWDVFISYSRRGDVPEWMKNHFHPRLQNSLDGHMRDEPRIFLDDGLEAGSVWPDRLEHALVRTKILIAIFSAQYFRSRWCLAEWDSFAQRERLVGRRGSGRQHDLIIPILFQDSDNFPEFARARQWEDLKQWNKPRSYYQDTPEYSGFHTRIEEIAARLARRLDQVPEWQPDWPVNRPDPPHSPPARHPRL